MMHMLFAATGRFAVRFRWAVVAAWVAATILASLLLPSLASVIKENNTDLLPASSPSLSAARLAAPFQDPNQTPVLVVIARDSGNLVTAHFDWGAVSLPLCRGGGWIASFGRFRWAAVLNADRLVGRTRGHPSRHAREHGRLRMRSDIFTRSFVRNDRSSVTQNQKPASSTIRDLP